MNKKLKIVFTISILGNLLLAGALGGMVLEKPQGRVWEKIKEGLSPESQQLVTKMFQDTWKDMEPVMRQSRDNHKYLADVVAADRFDPAMFDEAARRVRGVHDLMTKKKIESTKELLMKLPAEDRQKLAEQVANSFSWRGGGYRGRRAHDYPRPPEEKTDAARAP